MENYLIYIGKSALAAGAFYLVFLTLFQNRKQFVFNRFYLPASLAISFVIPLITFTTLKYIEPLPAAANEYSFLPETIQPGETTYPQFNLEWYHYLFSIYILGITFSLFSLCHGYIKALQIIRKSRRHELFNITVNITGLDVHPFSFFNKIVLSEETLTNPNLKIIVAHEKIHVDEKHTLDILFAEILFILQWFNPFAWLIKDAVKNNLEYKVDAQIAKNTNVQTYQLAMVALADKKGVAPFLTALNGSQLRNRIIMMKRSAVNKYGTFKKLAVLPLLAILIMGLANREVRTEVLPGQLDNTLHSRAQEVTTSHGKIIQGNDESLSGEAFSNKDRKNESGSESNYNDNVRPGNKNEALISQEGEYLTQLTDTGASKKSGVEFNPSNKLYIVDGIEYKGIINDFDANDIERIDILKKASATTLYGEKGKNGVILITTKSGNRSGLLENDYHTEIKGKVVSRHDSKPIPSATILYTANGNKLGTISNNAGEFSILVNDSNIFLEFLSEGYLKKEFVWDGNKELLVEMEPGDKSGIPDKTAENKLKWEKMLEKAGIERYPEGKEPIVIQDGYETLYNANDITDFYNPDIIKSIRYKKNTNIDIKRKELAKNGFIEIKTTLPRQEKKLYIIDGEEIFLKNQKPSVYIYPKQLQKMKELSKDEAVKKYGSKAKNGAVEITTAKAALGEMNQEVNKFLISIEYQNNQLILQGLEGCAFKELKFTINENKPVAINHLGMTTARGNNSSRNPGFLFEIEKINDQINLTGKTGTAWKELSYKPLNKKHFITETGVTRANNPLIVIDGIVTGFKSIDHINPADIQSVNVHKDAKAVERYGEKARDGVIEITLKPVRIYGELQFRKFIANEIKYPLLAQKSNIEKTVNLSVKIDNEGIIDIISEESSATDINLDEVVVISYKNQDTIATGYPSKDAAEEARKVKEQLLIDETKRVINKIPKLDIEKFKGKTVGIKVKFMLQ